MVLFDADLRISHPTLKPLPPTPPSINDSLITLYFLTLTTSCPPPSYLRSHISLCLVCQSIITLCIGKCLFHDATSFQQFYLFIQLKVVGTTAYIELILKLPGGKSIDLTDEVYNADVTYFQSMEFGTSTKKVSATSKSHPPPVSNSNALPLPTPSVVGSAGKVSLDSPLSPLTLSVSDNVSIHSKYHKADIICGHQGFIRGVGKRGYPNPTPYPPCKLHSMTFFV